MIQLPKKDDPKQEYFVLFACETSGKSDPAEDPHGAKYFPIFSWMHLANQCTDFEIISDIELFSFEIHTKRVALTLSRKRGRKKRV